MKKVDDESIMESITRERDAEKARADKLLRKLEKALLDQAAGEGLRIAGVTRTKLILPHMVDRLRIDMTLEDHPKPVVLDQYGHDTGLTVTDLVNEFKASDDFAGLFEPAKGKGGSSDRNGNGGPPRPNPFLRGSKAYNITEQVKLMKADPSLAERLKAEADSVVRR